LQTIGAELSVLANISYKPSQQAKQNEQEKEIEEK